MSTKVSIKIEKQGKDKLRTFEINIFVARIQDHPNSIPHRKTESDKNPHLRFNNTKRIINFAKFRADSRHAPVPALLPSDGTNRRDKERLLR